MGVTATLINEKSIDDFVSKEVLNSLSLVGKRKFFENRIRFLDNQKSELSKREKFLKDKLQKEIENLVVSLGAEILSVEQLKILSIKEIGVCESKIMDLQKEIEETEMQ